MATKRMSYLITGAVFCGLLFLGWKLTSRSAYESAEYTVLESHGKIELRQYPDLMLVVTEMASSTDGNDGSFGRLFQYISGGNKSDQKVAMTTPVFMEPQSDQANGQMGFVLPKEIAEATIPQPANGQVSVAKRVGGKFAVIRFSGRSDRKTRSEQQVILEKWIAEKGLETAGDPEVASYDPPWTPGPLRRNEILIRVGS